MWYIIEFVATAAFFYLVGANNPLASVKAKIEADAQAALKSAGAAINKATGGKG